MKTNHNKMYKEQSRTLTVHVSIVRQSQLISLDLIGPTRKQLNITPPKFGARTRGQVKLLGKTVRSKIVVTRLMKFFRIKEKLSRHWTVSSWMIVCPQAMIKVLASKMLALDSQIETRFAHFYLIFFLKQTFSPELSLFNSIELIKLCLLYKIINDWTQFIHNLWFMKSVKTCVMFSGAQTQNRWVYAINRACVNSLSFELSLFLNIST